jgi:Arginase family
VTEPSLTAISRLTLCSPEFQHLEDCHTGRVLPAMMKTMTLLSLVSFLHLTTLPKKLILTVALLEGAPFDTGTSYRPGARFGPSGIRQGSRRLNL